jgi:serine/threonine protein kinase
MFYNPVTNEWVAKLADFGSAQAFNKQSPIKGTLAYMAPECFQGGEIIGGSCKYPSTILPNLDHQDC